MLNSFIPTSHSQNHLNSICTDLNCKVCGSAARVFDVVDFSRQCHSAIYPDGLSGVPVYYHRCSNCGLIFTVFFDNFSAQDLKSFVYNYEYGKIDPDYNGARANRNANFVNKLSRFFLGSDGHGCDFGGGNGQLAALLRSKGVLFDSLDPFGEKHVSNPLQAYKLVTAFEVVEHSADPHATMKSLVNLTDRNCGVILIGTLTPPKDISPGKLSSWWYAAPRNGHVTFYSPRSFEILANNYGLKYQSITNTLHIFYYENSPKISRFRIILAKIRSKF